MTEAKKVFLAQQIEELESLIKYRDTINPAVSKVPVAWHLDHMLKVINGIYNKLRDSDQSKYKPDINFPRFILFAIGKIPRGRVQSPSSVRPPDVIFTDDIYMQLNTARKNLSELDALNENQHFTHLVFGNMNRKKTKRFIEIHTNHHLSIVRDILRKK